MSLGLAPIPAYLVGIILIEGLPHLASSAVQKYSLISLASAKNVTDLAGCSSLNVVQCDHLLLAGGEWVDGRRDESAKLLRKQRLFGPLSPVARRQYPPAYRFGTVIVE